MISIILYSISFPIILYDNFCAVRCLAEKPQIARWPSFFFIVTAITYGSIIGLWYNFGWKAGLTSLFVSWMFNKNTFRFFFHKYIHLKAQQLIQSNKFKTELKSELRLQEAYKLAEAMALENVTGKRF